MARVTFGHVEKAFPMPNVHGALQGVCADHREAVCWASVCVAHGWKAEQA
jgi:hypothetical protein